jgi:hypothetical protein
MLSSSFFRHSIKCCRPVFSRIHKIQLRQIPTYYFSKPIHNQRSVKKPLVRTYIVSSKILDREPFNSTSIQNPNSHTFVSSYYQLPTDAVVSFLTRNKISFKEALTNPDKLLIQKCPFCHDIKEKKSNMWKLYIDKKNGRFNCFRCGAKGNW